MQPLVVSRSSLVGKIPNVTRCCVNADWTRAAVMTSDRSLYAMRFPSTVLLSEQAQPPPVVKLADGTRGASDFAWCSKLPVLYVVADDGMSLMCFCFQNNNNTSGDVADDAAAVDEQTKTTTAPADAAATTQQPVLVTMRTAISISDFGIEMNPNNNNNNLSSSSFASDLLWAVSVPSEDVEAACLSTNRDEPTPVKPSGSSTAVMANLSFGSDRKVLALRADPARIGVWVHLRSMLVSFQFVCSSSSATSSSSQQQQQHQLQCIAFRRVPLRSSNSSPRWCVGPTSVVTLDSSSAASGSNSNNMSSSADNNNNSAASATATSELMVWDISGSSAVCTAHIPVGVSSSPRVSIHFGGDRVDTIIIFDGDDGTASWLDLTAEDRKQALRSKSRCTRPSRFDTSALAAHDPAALMLQPVIESNKFHSWNAFRSRFDPSLRHMFGHSLCFQTRRPCKLLELHAFETAKDNICVFALLKMFDDAVDNNNVNNINNTNNNTKDIFSSTSYHAVVLSAKRNEKLDEVAFPLPCVPVEHAGTFIGTSGLSQINNLHLCAPIVFNGGVSAVALEGCGTLNQLIQRFAHRAAGATRVLCRINDWDDASVRDATIFHAAQSGEVALASELFGLLDSEEDLSSAVAACSTLHKLFAGKYRELNVDDLMARERFEALVFTAIRFSEQLVLRLFLQQERQQRQQQKLMMGASFAAASQHPSHHSSSSSLSSSLVPNGASSPNAAAAAASASAAASSLSSSSVAGTSSVSAATRMNFATASDVRLVEEAIRSDDTVNNNSIATAGSHHALHQQHFLKRNEDAAIVASLLEGWCRMLECLRSCAQQKHAQPQFSDAILCRNSSSFVENQQQKPQQSSSTPTATTHLVVPLVKRILRLIEQGRISAATQLILNSHQVPEIAALQLITNDDHGGSFNQARHFVDVMSKFVLASVDSACFGDDDFSIVVSCITKCFPNAAAREKWLRSVIFSTDSFVVRNRLLALAAQARRTVVCSSSPPASSAAPVSFDALLVRDAFELPMMPSSSSSAVLANETNFSFLREKILRLTSSSSSSSGKNVGGVAMFPSFHSMPLLFRVVETDSSSKKKQSQLQEANKDKINSASLLFGTSSSSSSSSPTAAITGVASTFPLRMLRRRGAESSSSCDNNHSNDLLSLRAAEQQLQQYHVSLVEQAVFRVTTTQSSSSSSTSGHSSSYDHDHLHHHHHHHHHLLTAELSQLLYKIGHENFARSVLKYAEARLDLFVACCGAEVLCSGMRSSSSDPQQQQQLLEKCLAKLSMTTKTVSGGASISLPVRLVRSAFAASCCGCNGATDHLGVPRVVSLTQFASSCVSAKGNDDEEDEDDEDDHAGRESKTQKKNNITTLAFLERLLHLVDTARDDTDEGSAVRSALVLFADACCSPSSSSAWHHAEYKFQNPRTSSQHSSWLADHKTVRTIVPANWQEFLQVCDAALRCQQQKDSKNNKNTSGAVLGRLLQELARSFNVEPRGRNLRPHSEALADCTHHHHHHQQQATASLIVFRAVHAEEGDVHTPQVVNEIVDGFVEGNFGPLKHVRLTESCVRIVDDGDQDKNDEDDMKKKHKDAKTLPLDNSSFTAAAVQQQKREPRWRTLLGQLRIFDAAAAAKNKNKQNGGGLEGTAVTIEECLMACQEQLMAPTSLSSAQGLAEADTLLFLMQLGFEAEAQSIARSFQMSREENDKNSSSTTTTSATTTSGQGEGEGGTSLSSSSTALLLLTTSGEGCVDRDTGVAAWLPLVCGSSDEEMESEKRSRFRRDAKQHHWPRLLQHAFAAQLPESLIFELLSAAPSVQSAVFPAAALKTATADGAQWGKKMCASVSTRAFIRDMGVDALSRGPGMEVARSILLSLNASRSEDSISTQLETFFSAASGAFADVTELQLPAILSVLQRLMNLTPFPSVVAYRVVSDLALNLQLAGGGDNNNNNNDSGGGGAPSELRLFQKFCAFITLLADERYDTSTEPLENVTEDALLDFFAQYPAFVEFARTSIAKLCYSAGNVASVLHSTALFFRAFPAVGPRYYQSPHGASEAIVTLDDTLKEVLSDISSSSSSSSTNSSSSSRLSKAQQADRFRVAVPRLEQLLAVAKDFSRQATEMHLSADFTSKVWAASSDSSSAADNNPQSSMLLSPAAGMLAAKKPSSSSTTTTTAVRRFRGGAREVWQHYSNEFADIALFSGSLWSCESERGFFVRHLFQEWASSSSSSSSTTAQSSQQNNVGGNNVNFDDILGASVSSASSSDMMMMMMMLSPLQSLSEASFQRTSSVNIAGLLIWLVAFVAPATDLNCDVLLQLVSARLSGLKEEKEKKMQQQQQQSSSSSRQPAVQQQQPAAASSSVAISLAEQRLRHIQMLLQLLQHQVPSETLRYITMACLCGGEVPELEIEGFVLRIHDVCPNYDDLVGEKPSLDRATLQLLEPATSGNFFFKQWIARMFNVPRDVLASFSSSSSSTVAATATAGGSGGGGGDEQQQQQQEEENKRDTTTTTETLARLVQLVDPFVGSDRAQEISKTLMPSTASQILRDVLAMPCSSWTHAPHRQEIFDDDNKKGAVADAILTALEHTRDTSTEKNLLVVTSVMTDQQRGSMFNLMCNGLFACWIVPLLGYRSAEDAQKLSAWVTRQLNILSETYQPAVQHFGSADADEFRAQAAALHWANEVDALANLLLLLRNGGAVEDSSNSNNNNGTRDDDGNSNSNNKQVSASVAASKTTSAAKSTNAKRSSRLRPLLVPPVGVIISKLYDLIARIEDALAGAVDDSCFAEAKAFLAAVGWRVIAIGSSRNCSSSNNTMMNNNNNNNNNHNSNNINHHHHHRAPTAAERNEHDEVCCGHDYDDDEDNDGWLPELASKILSEAHYALCTLVNHNELAPVGRFVFAVEDATWVLTPILKYLLQVNDYHDAFIVPLAAASQIPDGIAMPSLTDSATRLALMHYFFAAADFEVEVCPAGSMYSYFGHNAPLAHGLEHQAWSMLQSLIETQKKPQGPKDAHQRRLEKLLDEVIQSFEQSAEAFFRAEMYDKCFACVQVVRLLDAQKRDRSAKIAGVALAGIPDSVVAGGAPSSSSSAAASSGISGAPELVRRQAALSIAPTLTDPLAILLMGSGADLSIEDWTQVMQAFVASTTAAKASLSRAGDLARMYRAACVTVGAQLPSRMRALLPNVPAGTQRTLWEDMISILEGSG